MKKTCTSKEDIFYFINFIIFNQRLHHFSLENCDKLFHPRNNAYNYATSQLLEENYIQKLCLFCGPTVSVPLTIFCSAATNKFPYRFYIFSGFYLASKHFFTIKILYLNEDLVIQLCLGKLYSDMYLNSIGHQYRPGNG